MITCPACNCEDVCGLWEQDLHDPVWRCWGCGERWPVRAGDRVALAVKEETRRAVDGVADVCKRAKWSEKRAVNTSTD